ncbi:hypothetical protein [Flagellimonas lutimaris]|uniref:hypothetical protein n=1 Tax=Flagellimonas lutimaris TaxID=475082 RepID=UPI003F5CC447
MKRWFIGLLCFGLLSVLVKCDSNGSDDIIEEQSILGKWKLTEAYISAGGPQYWVNIEDGEEIVFLDSGNFSSDRYTECTAGEFMVDEDILTLDFNCEGFESEMENEEGLITYQIELGENEFLLTPLSVICIEGCSYKYIRID